MHPFKRVAWWLVALCKNERREGYISVWTVKPVLIQPNRSKLINDNMKRCSEHDWSYLRVYSSTCIDVIRTVKVIELKWAHYIDWEWFGWVYMGWLPLLPFLKSEEGALYYRWHTLQWRNQRLVVSDICNNRLH